MFPEGGSTRPPIIPSLRRGTFRPYILWSQPNKGGLANLAKRRKLLKGGPERKSPFTLQRLWVLGDGSARCTLKCRIVEQKCITAGIHVKSKFRENFISKVEGAQTLTLFIINFTVFTRMR